MPFAGLGLHVLIALFFAVHVVRSGQQLYWLFILFSFPLLGSAVYFVVIYLPDSRLHHGARQVARAAVKTLDPQRELREAREAFDYTPTAQNQMRLATALLDSGQAEEAGRNYEACLRGPFASDADMRLGAARAFFACARYADAIGHLQAVRRDQPNYRPEAVSVLLARALGGSGQRAAAQAEFEQALARFGSFECRAEFAIWAASVGERDLVASLQVELARSMQRWGRPTRELNRALLRRLESAYQQVALPA